MASLASTLSGRRRTSAASISIGLIVFDLKWLVPKPRGGFAMTRDGAGERCTCPTVPTLTPKSANEVGSGTLSYETNVDHAIEIDQLGRTKNDRFPFFVPWAARRL